MDALYLGVDPGQTGGWGLLDQSGAYVAADRWRDGHTTYLALASYAPRVALCHLEHINFFPRLSKGLLIQAQTLLISAGRWHQILDILQIPYRLVHPQTWQAAYGLYHWRRRRAKLGNPKSGYNLTPWDLAARFWPEAGIKGQGQSGPAVGLLLAEHARTRSDT